MSDHANDKKPTAVEIKSMLSSGGHGLTDKQAADLCAFVEQLGIERACQAIELLERSKSAV